jgi:hypothetical protein
MGQVCNVSQVKHMCAVSQATGEPNAEVSAAVLESMGSTWWSCVQLAFFSMQGIVM